MTSLLANPAKPLGHRNYGSIPHLACSRMGPGDHSIHEGQAAICTIKTRDRHDRIWVTEKLDGSNVGVARIDGEMVALGRAGYLASTSNFEQHRLFAEWVARNDERFRDLLEIGERCVGEWLAQAHGTRYDLRHEPFVLFDMLADQNRLPWEESSERASCSGFATPQLLNDGRSPMSAEDAVLKASEMNTHGADSIEGAVWRVERRGKFDFMAKFVRPEKVDGILLPEVSGLEEVWNWRPSWK